MPQNSTHSPRPERPPSRQRSVPTAADLVAAGSVTPQQVYAATIVLARLHDRRIALTMTVEEMCEVLGYLGDGRRPKSVPKNRVVSPQLRGSAGASRSRRDADG